MKSQSWDCYQNIFVRSTLWRHMQTYRRHRSYFQGTSWQAPSNHASLFIISHHALNLSYLSILLFMMYFIVINIFFFLITIMIIDYDTLCTLLYFTCLYYLMIFDVFFIRFDKGLNVWWRADLSDATGFRVWSRFDSWVLRWNLSNMV